MLHHSILHPLGRWFFGETCISYISYCWYMCWLRSFRMLPDYLYDVDCLLIHCFTCNFGNWHHEYSTWLYCWVFFVLNRTVEKHFLDQSLVESLSFLLWLRQCCFLVNFTSNDYKTPLVQVRLGWCLVDHSWSFAYWDGTTFLAHYWCISPTSSHPQKATSTQWSATQSTTRTPLSTVICVSWLGITLLGCTLLTSQQSILMQWQTAGRHLHTPLPMIIQSWIWLTPSCWAEHLTASPWVDGAWVAQ